MLKKLPVLAAAGTAALLALTGCVSVAQTKAESCAVISQAKLADLSPDLKSQKSIQKAIDAYSDAKAQIGYEKMTTAIDTVIGSYEKSKEQLAASEKLSKKIDKQIADGTFDPSTLDELKAPTAEESAKLAEDAQAALEICGS